jgi:hypothetical protein
MNRMRVSLASRNLVIARRIAPEKRAVNFDAMNASRATRAAG